MKKVNTVKIITAALFVALTCVSTMIIHIPSPTGGYVHPGDAVVLLASFLLGPLWGALSAALGSAMADLFAGYAIYVPGTFIIKALMGFAAGMIFKSFGSKKIAAVLAAVAAELIMVAGYLVYEYFPLGIGEASLANIPANLVQGAFGVVCGCILLFALDKVPYFKNFAEEH